MFKLKATLLIGVVIGLVGCDKLDSAKHEASKTAANIIGHDEIKGYKFFVFGMSANEVAKLPECVEAYKDQYIDRLKSLDIERQESVNLPLADTDPISSHKLVIAEYEAGTSQNITDEQYQTSKRLVNDYNNSLQSLKDAVAKRTNEIETNNNKVNSFSSEIVDKWKQNAVCNIDFMNENKKIYALFEQNKLTGVAIAVGEFNNERYQSIAKALGEKYGTNQSVSEEQIHIHITQLDTLRHRITRNDMI